MIPELFAAAALLLAVAGIAKLRRPGPAARLLTDLAALRRLRHADLLVRVIGAAEVAVGAAALATGARVPAVLVALAYTAFAAVAIRQLAGDGPRRACGCFGTADGPMGPAHLVLDTVAVVAAALAALDPPGPALLTGPGLVAVVAIAQVVLLAALGYLAVTALPALLARTKEAR